MNVREQESAQHVRSRLERGLVSPRVFRSALLSVAPSERDVWLNLLLGLGELPDDDADLPKDCVPYLPCSVDAVLRVVDGAPVRACDVFVDVGSGVGRAAALVHLLTGAAVIGIEIQHGLADASRKLAARLQIPRFSIIEGDAANLAGSIAIGSIFFLYCPFSGPRLERLLAHIEPIARTRMLRICCVDVPIPARSWLSLARQVSPDVAIYRTTLHAPPVPLQ